MIFLLFLNAEHSPILLLNSGVQNKKSRCRALKFFIHVLRSLKAISTKASFGCAKISMQFYIIQKHQQQKLYIYIYVSTFCSTNYCPKSIFFQVQYQTFQLLSIQNIIKDLSKHNCLTQHKVHKYFAILTDTIQLHFSRI